MITQDNVKAIIVDDELKSSEALEWLLQMYFPDCDIISNCQDPIEALAKVHITNPDLLFLDIQMPVLDGFQFLAKMKARNTKVIFVTAYNDKIPKMLKELNIPFLLKPIDHEDLQSLIEKVRLNQIEKPSVSTIDKLTKSVLEGI